MGGDDVRIPVAADVGLSRALGLVAISRPRRSLRCGWHWVPWRSSHAAVRRPGGRRRDSACVPGVRHAAVRAACRPGDGPLRSRRLAHLRKLGARHPAQRSAHGRRPGSRRAVLRSAAVSVRAGACPQAYRGGPVWTAGCAVRGTRTGGRCHCRARSTSVRRPGERSRCAACLLVLLQLEASTSKSRANCLPRHLYAAGDGQSDRDGQLA